MEEAKLLTIRQVSEYLFGDFNRSLRGRVFHLIEANDVQKIRDGKQYYVPRKELLRLLGED
jgi:hypothetical protein